jgi:MSHA biogenesis protein MshE
MDMGAPAYLLATSLAGIVAQRLVRKLCTVCAKPAELDANERAWLRQELAEGLNQADLRQARGCNHCNGTGYHGRQAIYELLEVDADLALLLNRGDTSAFRKAAQQRLLGQTLRDEALRLVRGGITSVAEAMRVTHQVDE